jgi:hypothetical protein
MESPMIQDALSIEDRSKEALVKMLREGESNDCDLKTFGIFCQSATFLHHFY